MAWRTWALSNKASPKYYAELLDRKLLGIQTKLGDRAPGRIGDGTVEWTIPLSPDQLRAVDLALRGTTAAAPRLEDLTLEEVERLLIQKALSRYDGNVSRAAQALGLSRSALYRRIAAYEL